jgi:hypothetical protein
MRQNKRAIKRAPSIKQVKLSFISGGSGDGGDGGGGVYVKLPRGRVSQPPRISIEKSTWLIEWRRVLSTPVIMKRAYRGEASGYRNILGPPPFAQSPRFSLPAELTFPNKKRPDRQRFLHKFLTRVTSSPPSSRARAFKICEKFYEFTRKRLVRASGDTPNRSPPPPSRRPFCFSRAPALRNN